MEQSDEATLAVLVGSGRLDLPVPGGGRTWERYRALAEIGAEDLSLVRLAEGHADALAILAEAEREPERLEPHGVWAADPPDDRVIVRDGRLSGRKRYASGATTVTRALVTAFVADEARPRLFLVDLAHPGARPVPGTWPAVGMAGSDSLDVELDDVLGEAICGEGWYLDRAGFWAGAVQVAACWWGGALGARRVLERRLADRGGDDHALAHLGAVVAATDAMEAVLVLAAGAIDAGEHDRRLALSVRAVVEAGCTTVLDHVGRATGSGPMVHDPAHARRVADLPVYLRQSHAEADLALLGGLALEDRR